MTLHGTETVEVGVRELHDQLSRYVRQVEAGGEVIVTMRGRRVARMTGIDAGDPLADLRARGLVSVAGARRAAPRRVASAAPVSDLVDEQRR